METFIQWVMQIIIFLLLVAVVDLLIPENKFQKYVHLVAGLIFMLIFLQPLFYLLQTDVNHSIESGWELFTEEGTSTDSFENMINIQKDDIQASQHAYVVEQMADQLMDLANPTLIDQYHVEIYNIEFLFTGEKTLDYDHLEEVIVYVQEPSSGIGAVTPIEEIIIFGEEQTEQLSRSEIIAIHDHLREIWEIGEKELFVKWGGGRS